MSYDVSIFCPTCRHSECDLNYTWNCAPMFYDALTWANKGVELGINQLNEMKCSEAKPLLSLAINRMKDNPDIYKPMNPANGWGDYEGAIAFLEAILGYCEKLPDATIHVF